MKSGYRVIVQYLRKRKLFCFKNLGMFWDAQGKSPKGQQWKNQNFKVKCDKFIWIWNLNILWPSIPIWDPSANLSFLMALESELELQEYLCSNDQFQSVLRRKAVVACCHVIHLITYQQLILTKAKLINNLNGKEFKSKIPQFNLTRMLIRTAQRQKIRKLPCTFSSMWCSLLCVSLRSTHV